MGLARQKCEVILTDIILNNLRLLVDDENIVHLSYYWHDFLEIIGDVLSRGGFISGENLLDDNGVSVFPDEIWEELSDKIYEDVCRSLEDDDLIDSLSWTNSGHVDAVETAVVIGEGEIYPSLLTVTFAYCPGDVWD